MDRQNVDLIRTHDPIDDAVGPVNDLSNHRIPELRNGPTGLREVDQSIGGRNELGYYN